MAALVDIHCHLLPGLDDGSPSCNSSLAMARMAVNDGIRTTIVTPHQLGKYGHIGGEQIRQATRQLRGLFAEHGIGMNLLPGADVRIEPDLVKKIKSGEVLTLADQGKHVLLELPHELYFPLEPVLDQLQDAGLAGILSHPERNQGILAQPDLLMPLVDAGCLMQVTAGSLLGAFGLRSQQLAESMLRQGLVHVIATDAHGSHSRRPLMRRAFERIVQLADQVTAEQVCCVNPALICQGSDVPGGRQSLAWRWPTKWFRWASAG